MDTKELSKQAQARVDFGRERVSPTEKTKRVADVFSAVASRYDIMNDLMSLGTHRLFKRMVLEMTGLREGQCILDLAGGTGDMSRLFAPVVGQNGLVVLADPNEPMIHVGRDRLLDQGLAQVRFCRTLAEDLPFTDDRFDCACISFGLRNFTDKDQALLELLRVLKPGGALVVLEFSHPENRLVKGAYEAFQALWPAAGKAVVGDARPYEYLVESIKVHPDQPALRQMFEDAGFVDVEYFNLLGGTAAIHRGVKPRV
jgi:demethylmenaquinone methyltransferase/2-methoxy-6-polyprenyl-1,4-benzoquinol methylase